MDLQEQSKAPSKKGLHSISQHENLVEEYLEKLAKNRQYLEKKLAELDNFIEQQVERSKLQDDESLYMLHYKDYDFTRMQHYVTNGVDYESQHVDFVRDIVDGMSEGPPRTGLTLPPDITVQKISTDTSSHPKEELLKVPSIDDLDSTHSSPDKKAEELDGVQKRLFAPLLLKTGHLENQHLPLSDESRGSGSSSTDFPRDERDTSKFDVLHVLVDDTSKLLRQTSLSRRTTEELLQEIKKLNIHEVLDSTNRRYHDAFANFVRKGFGTTHKMCIQYHQTYIDHKNKPNDKIFDMMIKEYAIPGGKYYSSIFADYMSLSDDDFVKNEPFKVCTALEEIVLDYLSGECLDSFLASSIYKKIASKIEESREESIDLSVYYVEEYKDKHLDLKAEDLEFVGGSNDEVKCSTVDKLIELTTSPNQSDYDNEILFTLMLTYRSFISPKDLMEKLMIRYFTPWPKDETDLNEWNKAILQRIRLRVTKLIKYWLEKHSYDFEGKLMEKLEDFIRIMKKSKGEIFSKTIEKVANNVKAGNHIDPWNPVEKAKCPSSIIPKKIPDEILDWNEKEIARQLTLFELDMFRKVLPKECLNQNWDPKNRETKAPNLFAIMNWFNNFSLFVSYKIVSGKRSNIRSTILSKVIKTANECILLGNYNGAFELISATTITPIHRLKKTWGLVSRQDMKLHQDLLSYISSSNNFKFLREKISSAKSPYIPYVGLLFKDLTYIDDINQDLLNGKINFYKRKQISNLIRELQNAVQINSYNYIVLEEFSSRLKDVSNFMQDIDEKTLSKLSFEVEPKQ